MALSPNRLVNGTRVASLCASLSVVFTEVRGETVIIDNFNIDLAKSLVDGVIASNGEGFVYKRPSGSDCQYVHRNMRWDDSVEDYVSSDDVAPGCVWGHALFTAAIPLEEFENVEGSSIEEVLSRFQARGLVGEVEDLAAAWSYIVQHKQDTGSTWGEAREYANALLEESASKTVHEWDRAQWMRDQV